jgi:hypothetical protein
MLIAPADCADGRKNAVHAFEQDARMYRGYRLGRTCAEHGDWARRWARVPQVAVHRVNYPRDVCNSFSRPHDEFVAGRLGGADA